MIIKFNVRCLDFITISSGLMSKTFVKVVGAGGGIDLKSREKCGVYCVSLLVLLLASFKKEKKKKTCLNFIS